MTDKAYAVPLHELLDNMPLNERLVIDDPNGMGTRFIPIGRLSHEAAAELRRLHEVNVELLEACKAALSDDKPYIEKCRAAIAKATGEQNGN